MKKEAFFLLILGAVFFFGCRGLKNDGVEKLCPVKLEFANDCDFEIESEIKVWVYKYEKHKKDNKGILDSSYVFENNDSNFLKLPPKTTWIIDVEMGVISPDKSVQGQQQSLAVRILPCEGQTNHQIFGFVTKCN